MRPPFEIFKHPVCRGCYALGTSCGTCEKCSWYKANPPNPARDRTEMPEEIRPVDLNSRLEVMKDADTSDTVKKMMLNFWRHSDFFEGVRHVGTQPDQPSDESRAQKLSGDVIEALDALEYLTRDECYDAEGLSAIKTIESVLTSRHRVVTAQKPAAAADIDKVKSETIVALVDKGLRGAAMIGIRDTIDYLAANYNITEKE